MKVYLYQGLQRAESEEARETVHYVFPTQSIYKDDTINSQKSYRMHSLT
jgi:hypothetical protein